MGCGNTNTNNNLLKTNNRSSDYQLKSTLEINAIQQEALDPKNMNFIKLKEDAKKLSELIWKDLVIDDRTFLNLINALHENADIYSFIMDNVEVRGALDTFINIARILMKKTRLKTLEFKSLYNYGNKKAKSIAMIMENNMEIERLVLKEIELDEIDAEFIGLILNKLSSSLLYFEISLLFFSSKMEEFLKGLETNNSIQQLILNKINLRPDDFEFLVRAVSSNPSLIRLDVSNNPVKNGVKIFSEIYLTNLQNLQLNNCDIDEEAFYLLVDGVKRLKNLLNLELNMNFIKEASKETIKIFFDENTSLLDMYILRNPICKRDFMYYLKDSDLVKVVSEY